MLRRGARIGAIASNKNAMKTNIDENIPGYTYGQPGVARSPITPIELELLKQSAGFTEEDGRYLRAAGAVLGEQTAKLVEQWRAVIAKHPHLAQYSQRPDGQTDAHYSNDSGLRFQQWILDTCLRPYDQDWLNYQQEIALRHTSVRKNKTDNVESAAYIPLRYVLAFASVINDANIIKPFLSAKGHSAEEVDQMYQAWCKSVLLQIALWAEPYTNPKLAVNEW
jgi:hypothetical protein